VRLHTVHHDVNRFRTPLWRADIQEEFAAESWAAVLEGVGGRLREIVTRHGPGAVGVYSGNAAGQSLGAILGVTAFLQGIGTKRHYSALTLDNAEMFVVTEACLGNPMSTFTADYLGSDLVLLVGTDPLSSQPSQAQSHPNGVRELLEVARRGDLVVVDPRRSTTSRKASLHLQPKPGSDVALLAFLVREVLSAEPERARDDALLDEVDVETVRDAVDPWTVERAASATGLPQEALWALVDRLRHAHRPLVWSGLGVLLGPDGTVGYWLTLVLQSVLGGLDRRGGWLLHGGAADLPSLFTWTGVRGYDPDNRSRIGGFPSVLGTWASATLAQDILDPSEDRLRALVVVGGNPARSLPDSIRARKALASLELLVVLDLRPSPTTEIAHAVLPARSWLARAELPLHQSATRRRRDLLYTDAVVGSVGESRDDWDILIDLTRAAGRRPFGNGLADAILRVTGIGHRGIGLAALAARAPRSASILPWQKRGLFSNAQVIGALRARGTDLPRGRVRLGIPAFVEAMNHSPGRLPPESDLPLLQLISSVRPLDKMNSWIQGRTAPPSLLHPDDVAEIGSRRIRIRRPGTRDWPLSIAVQPDDSVRRGVLVLPWGDPRLDANAVIGTDHLEPFTGQPISNGSWVEASPDDRQASHDTSS